MATGPGRPRSERAHRAVLDATDALLREIDYPAITVDRIAAESGVSKRTIYRWWRNKAAIILELLQAGDVEMPDTGDVEGDLTSLLTGIFQRVLHDRSAQAIRGLVADAQFDETFAAELVEYVKARRGVCVTLLKRAQAAGQLDKDADLELIADLYYGAYWHRLLIGHAPLTADYARDVVASILRGAGPRPDPDVTAL
ncbi:MAG: TetR/AcrR family transcriptional regulator [Nocardioides sp.]